MSPLQMLHAYPSALGGILKPRVVLLEATPSHRSKEHHVGTDQIIREGQARQERSLIM